MRASNAKILNFPAGESISTARVMTASNPHEIHSAVDELLQQPAKLFHPVACRRAVIELRTEARHRVPITAPRVFCLGSVPRGTYPCLRHRQLARPLLSAAKNQQSRHVLVETLQNPWSLGMSLIFIRAD